MRIAILLTLCVLLTGCTTIVKGTPDHPIHIVADINVNLKEVK